MTGIYMIRNKINGHCYIGQSVDIHKRWIDHKTPSKQNRGTVLDRALTKYGCDNFELIVLEECSEKALDEREMYYIALFKPAYNMNQGGSGNRDHRLSAELKKKLRILGKLQWSQKTDEERKAIIDNNLKGPRKGHPVTEGTRRKLRQSALQQFAGGMLEEHKRKISEALKGKKKEYVARSVAVEQLDKDTGKVIKVYKTIKEAAETIGRSPGGIIKACKGKQKTSGGYRWRCYQPR